MWFFTPIVLICIAGVDVRECRPQYGARVVERGDPVESDILCERDGQALLAGTAQGRYLAVGEVVKIMCERPKG